MPSMVVCLGLALLPQVLTAATISGSVQLTDTAHRKITQNGKNANVVVWLKPENPLPPPTAGKRVRMLQKDKTFTPHLLAIRTGTSVDFPNLDPIFHNAFSNFNGKIFDLSLYAPGTSRGVRFDQPGIVRIFCNIHPTMSAVIVVVDSPYFTITAEDGRFSLPDVPEGEYAVHFFYERATPETLQKLIHTISVKDSAELPPVAMSETGYLPVAHTNKYGREYAKDSEGSKNYSLPVK